MKKSDNYSCHRIKSTNSSLSRRADRDKNGCLIGLNSSRFPLLTQLRLSVQSWSGGEGSGRESVVWHFKPRKALKLLITAWLSQYMAPASQHLDLFTSNMFLQTFNNTKAELLCFLLHIHLLSAIDQNKQVEGVNFKVVYLKKCKGFQSCIYEKTSRNTTRFK